MTELYQLKGFFFLKMTTTRQQNLRLLRMHTADIKVKTITRQNLVKTHLAKLQVLSKGVRIRHTQCEIFNEF